MEGIINRLLSELKDAAGHITEESQPFPKPLARYTTKPLIQDSESIGYAHSPKSEIYK
jgi:hypothetical protein